MRVKARATYIDPAHPEITQETSTAIDVPVVGDYLGGWSPSIFKSLEISPSGNVEVDMKQVPDSGGERRGEVKFRAIGTTMSGEKVDVSHLAQLDISGDADGVSADGMTVTVKSMSKNPPRGTTIRVNGLGLDSRDAAGGDSFATLVYNA